MIPPGKDESMKALVSHGIIAAMMVAASFAANGATYYVDASAGNDLWQGTSPSPSGTPVSNGPWQSLNRVRSATLSPGDSVLLKCGESWSEELGLSASGTTTAPIAIGSYPAGCTNRPIIDGSTALKSEHWAAHGNGIYKTRWPANQVLNGSFDSGLVNWAKWSAGNDANMSLTSTCGTSTGNCMSFISGGGTGSSLAYSNGFPILSGARYSVSFRLNVPAGVTVGAIVRRAATPWEPLGFKQTIAGTGDWATYTFTFTATRTAPSARLDIEVPPSGKRIFVDDVSVVSAADNPAQIFANLVALSPAHHPNLGYDTSRPSSVYLATPTNADRVLAAGKYVSTYVPVGSDLVLPGGASIDSNTTIRVRTTNWLLEERKVQSYGSGRINLSSPTSYPLLAGYGYFLTGALWMLDSPGEWFYDAGQRTLYVRMPDSLTPGNRVRVGHLSSGLDVTAKSYVRIENIQIQRTSIGVKMANSRNVTIRTSVITDTSAEGAEASGSQGALIEANVLRSTGRDAVSGVDEQWVTAQRLRAINNVIVNSGLTRSSGQVTSLPSASFGAIRPGHDAVVTGNSIDGSGYVGISAMSNGTVSGNAIANACLVLDDCAGIYANAAGAGTTISGNIVSSVPGNSDGRPSTATHTVGIYLDDLANGITVLDNTATGADHGIQLHNAYNNRIEGNTIYGNRKTQLWLQEQTRVSNAAGDLYGNLILSNHLFPTTTDSAIVHESNFAETAHFANYDRNLHSTLLSPRISTEKWQTGGVTHKFPEWQAAVNSSGVPRNLDLSGDEISQGKFASYRVIGANLVSNGDFAVNTNGWGAWNLTAPFAQKYWETCPPGHCLRFVAGASESILSSPYFSVTQGTWYRLTFDLKTATPGQTLGLLVRRGGGGSNTYERLMGAPETISGNGNWNRYSILFQASKTVNARDPITLDNGARVDFEAIKPGQSISVANVSLQQVSPIEATFQARLLTNTTQTVRQVACPDESSRPELCSMYVRFPDKTRIAWPVALDSMSSQIVFTQDQTLIDSDEDGIPDVQDACAATPPGIATNNRGCSYAQSYP
jgi:parallel beta-helix repeat protein